MRAAVALKHKPAVAIEAFDEIVANATRHVPDAVIDGVLVQEMVAGGTEAILGINNDL